MATPNLCRKTAIAIVVSICVVLGAAAVSIPYYVRLRQFNSTKSTLSGLEYEICLYAIDNGELPTTDEGLGALIQAPSGLPDVTKWRGPYLARLRLPGDVWGRVFEYERLGPDTFRVYSNGADGTPNTYDDIEIVSSRKQCDCLVSTPDLAIRPDPEKVTPAVETPAPQALGEAGRSPTEKTSR